MTQHELPHGGVKDAGRDAAHWDQRYAAADQLWSVEPNATVAEIVRPLNAGPALDLGAGEGRHAVWMAARGWDVTAVDFSAVGLERGRRAAWSWGVQVDWVQADVRYWQPPDGMTYKLVLLAYLHIDDDVFSRARTWVAPRGYLVVVGHALRNLYDGVGGPQDSRLLYTSGQLRAAAAGFVTERIGEVIRPTDAGDAIDLALVARRP